MAHGTPPPDYKTRGGQYSIKATGRDELTLIPSQPGEYAVEIFGYSTTRYAMDAQQVGQVQADASVAPSTAYEKTPRAAPSLPPQIQPVGKEAVPLPPGGALDYRILLPIVAR